MQEKPAASNLHMRLEELNKAYADLVRRYKDLSRERNELVCVVDEVTRSNKILSEDFQALMR